jgi:hypothetical protein
MLEGGIALGNDHGRPRTAWGSHSGRTGVHQVSLGSSGAKRRGSRIGGRVEPGRQAPYRRRREVSFVLTVRAMRLRRPRPAIRRVDWNCR